MSKEPGKKRRRSRGLRASTGNVSIAAEEARQIEEDHRDEPTLEEDVPKQGKTGEKKKSTRSETVALSDDDVEIVQDGVPEVSSAEESGEILADEELMEVEEEKKVPPPAPPGVPATKKGKVAKKNKAEWHETFFDENYLRTLPYLTPGTTRAEAEFLVSSLSLEPGTQILDVGCGYGRHAMELAARGLHVVALDSSLPLLLRGAEEAQRRSLQINFVHADMRQISFEEQFDGVFCLFTTFGYFDDKENLQALQSMARALKPGGRLVLEVLNRDYIIQDLPTRVWWEGDGCLVLDDVEFNYFASRVFSKRSVVFDDGRQSEQEISFRAYSLHELGELLHQTGFTVVEVSGSLATRGRFFGNHSREIILVAQKNAA